VKKSAKNAIELNLKEKFVKPINKGALRSLNTKKSTERKAVEESAEYKSIASSIESSDSDSVKSEGIKKIEDMMKKALKGTNEKIAEKIKEDEGLEIRAKKYRLKLTASQDFYMRYINTIYIYIYLKNV